MIMNNEKFLPEIPYGTRDFLPVEAARKRALENRLAKLFAAWGYEEVVTPVMEYLDTLLLGSGSSMEDHMFKFFGRNNRTLALRHEMTTPIARLASGRLHDAPLPLKLSYISSVYRYEQAQIGRKCEFYQAGVELLGSGSVTADAEIIALAVESLLSAGLDNFRLCLGHVDFIGGLLEEYGLSTSQRKKIQTAIENKNLVRLQNLVDEIKLNPHQGRTLSEIAQLYGQDDILTKARSLAVNSRSQAALDNLTQINELLQHYGARKYVAFDLGLIRDFQYYTGMVFEVYVPTLGFPVCGGGRYDNLLSDFRQDYAATGFALGIERVLLALNQPQTDALTKPKDVFVSYSPGKTAAAVAKACELRKAGLTVELALEAQTDHEAEKYRVQGRFARLEYFA